MLRQLTIGTSNNKFRDSADETLLRLVPCEETHCATAFYPTFLETLVFDCLAPERVRHVNEAVRRFDDCLRKSKGAAPGTVPSSSAIA